MTTPPVALRAAYPRVTDPARLAALRALCLEDGRADAAFDRLTRLAARFLKAPAALVNLLECDRQTTRSAFGSPDRFRRGDVGMLSESICKFTIENGAPVAIDRTRDDPRSAHTAAVREGSAAYCGVPLLLRSGHAVGTLCVLDDVERTWTPEELDVLSELADAATSELELIAVTRAAEARAAAEENSRRLNAVLSITDVALTQATLDDTLSSILERLREVLEADTATILLLDDVGERLVVRASVGLEIEVARGVSMRVGEGLAGRIAMTREPLIVADVRTAGTVSPYLAQRLRSLLGAPLLLDDVLLGVVHVGTHRSRDFDEDDVRLLTLAASRLAAAVERARLFDAERALRKTAESASRAKSEFLAVMSHELRTPLNIIGGHVQLLEDGVHGALTKGQFESLARVRAAQRHLAGVIGDILEHVALDRGPRSEAHPLVSVSAVMERACTGMSEFVAARDIALRCTGDESAFVAIDADVLHGILVRLLGNAIKFSPVGGEVTVACGSTTARVWICITDSGPGIAEGKIDSIFEAFGRADSSYRRGHEGIGLGLTIARARAREAGGDLTARNVAGRGTEFRLDLPLGRAEVMNAPREA